MSKERKELFCGSQGECAIFVIINDPNAQAWDQSTKLEVVRNAKGPDYSVFHRRKAHDRTIKAAISRETRERFRVQGVTKEPMRPLVITLEPGDVISFRPKGTQQKVQVPIKSLYHFARFTAARAIAAARQLKRRQKKFD